MITDALIDRLERVVCNSGGSDETRTHGLIRDDQIPDIEAARKVASLFCAGLECAVEKTQVVFDDNRSALQPF
jgi:hypothetical protein